MKYGDWRWSNGSPPPTLLPPFSSIPKYWGCINMTDIQTNIHTNIQTQEMITEDEGSAGSPSGAVE